MIYAALAVAIVALLLAGVLFARVRVLERRLAGVPKDGDVVRFLQELDQDLSAAEKTLSDLQPRLAQLEAKIPAAVSYLGVISYDAFGDIAGKLSRSIAFLDRRGDGLVLSALVGRGETMFFTKEIREGEGVEELSPEERSAVARALRG